MPGSVPPPPQRGLLTETISRQLRQEILSGEPATGAKLPSERELAVRFGASRNVVREVLRRLEAQHLIEIAPGRGSFVAQRSAAEAHSYDALYRTSRPTVRQVMAARIVLEVETVALATQNGSEAEVAAIRAAHERVLAATDVVTKAQADVDFHDTIAAAAGNPVLRIMLASISGMMFEIMLRSNSDTADPGPGVPHHPEIVAAIEARDVELARHCMHEHLALAGRSWGPEADLSVDVMASRQLENLLDRSAQRSS
ncbi:FadR/GntR family transcriptional regulator [Crossiella cryophila]|uniref:DNA-binding FadR family transcriptional regulator n=1 Tax=Crossiella cryophila TaxID=43355 RepID=A0A7W7FV58_9PSEU|nr:FadR/GntR family transcriptional regulator [Crossiella cryophila]MBB4678695.1 DNA-binding FadR family transcriptional regulator [Crossiella cryophila]